MAQPDSMFLFEIFVESLTSYINCREFCITSQFADIFNINLKDPNERRSFLPKHSRKYHPKRKLKYSKVSMAPRVQTGQSILFANNVDTLISNMKQYPMELCLWSKVVPDYKIGSTHIPWSAPYYDYLGKLHKKQEPPPVCIRGDYNVFDEFTSKRMAVIKLNIKLSYLKDKITTSIKPICQGNQQGLVYKSQNQLNSEPSTVRGRPINLTEETGTIKTIYNGEQRKVKKYIRDKNRSSKQGKFKFIEEPSDKENVTELAKPEVAVKTESRKLNKGIVILVKSETDLNPVNNKKNNQTVITKSKSCSSIEQEHVSMFNYIFGGKPSGPFGNRVYYVGYFTVANDFADSPKSAGSPPKSAESPPKSAESVKSSPSKTAASAKSAESVKSTSDKSKSDETQAKDRYKFRICSSECPSKKDLSTRSVCSLDLPLSASHLISVKKCDRVICDHRIMRELPTPPSDRILIDLSSRERDCCDVAKEVQEVVGGIKAKMKFGEDDPCYCECECTFGFTKKTTFCNICGGYEVPGDEFLNIPRYELPFPCPIFHKLVEKGKLKSVSTSGSEGKKDKKEIIDTKKDKIEVGETKRDKKESVDSKRDKKHIGEFKKEKKDLGESKRDKKEDRDKRDVSEGKRDKREAIESKKDKREASEPRREKKEKSDSAKEKREASESRKERKEAKPKTTAKNFESDKDVKKSKRKINKERFKFNYGYTAPKIGHSRCALGCDCTVVAIHNRHHRHHHHHENGSGGNLSGSSPSRLRGGAANYHDYDDGSITDLSSLATQYVIRRRKRNVPKTMGWLWNAEYAIPGVRNRPFWKPGAATKHVVRLLKIAKNPGEVLAKKRKKDLGKVKRPLQRPLLVVAKKDGEYTVTMETMKTYAKPRTLNQYPYEDKPLITYTIGRTPEENLERKKKKERAQRRLERLQRDFIQGAFRDMCHEICLKTYQQALGILPDAERPDCPCYPAEPGPDRTDLDHSCSCSEDKEMTGSDTDSDQWVVEFTPPTATFDPTFKPKKILTSDSSTQYTYMDYRVKLLDRYGNPVPRYFKGPDGKQQCSDLGGFWSPNHKWLEINTDGFIGPDGKWAPNIFFGPNGEQVDAETGKFQALNGKWLVVGVDGYVDVQGKWKFYPKPKGPEAKKTRSTTGKKGAGDKKDQKPGGKASEATWSCFGTVSPKLLSKMGIVGHGHDKKLLLSTLKDMLAQGEDVKIPEPPLVPRSNKQKSKHSRKRSIDRKKCKHATPSDKGIVAVDEHGNKTYFRLKEHKNRRPKDRMTTLTDQGISLSSFHVPCFHSFISSEIMKKQQYDRLVALAKAAGGGEQGPQKCRTASTQADYKYVV